MTNSVDTKYLPAVIESRRLAAARAKMIADRLHTPTGTLSFLLNYLSMRIGPLRPIPDWLDTSAEACEADHPAIAAELRDAAELELLHQRALNEDLREIYKHLGGLEVQQPLDPRIDRHSRLRGLVPTRSEPLLVLAIDLELAELDRVLGPALLVACRRSLGPLLDACRFIRARIEDTNPRIHARHARLCAVLESYPHRALSWAVVATNVTQSYLEALEACADQAAARRPSGPRTSWSRPSCTALESA
ncbi:hypothetical protein DB30_05113 [Enhygromyxa salina]|uniref:Uncharacterized protein n=1 Tax=Enhygromyxa salina TaxID=215803 RepID=A0A0C2D7B6_9BACT|nr:hypothetical protein [Enhygromyxa salina]KIG15922.1 hypothetical protein DB30_05113 [Enhygromyxa salina]